MSKAFTCRELGGICDLRFSGSSLNQIMQSAMIHMQSDEEHKEHIMNLADTTGEDREQWMKRMQGEFEERAED